MANLFEQIVADYLTGKGYLTKLNVNYRKADGKQTGSDIDVLAFHPLERKVIVGDCKGGNWGFSGDWLLTSAQLYKDRFKAIFDPDWAEGLAQQVEKEFGTRKFTYTIYTTFLDGPAEEIKKKKRVAGNRIKVVTLKEIIDETFQRVNTKGNSSVEPTMLGRFVQLLKYGKIELRYL